MKYLSHFKKHDPILYKIAKTVSLTSKRQSTDFFVDLCEQIVSQQLSIKAADTIFARFKKLFPKEKITIKKTSQLTPEQIRSCGISLPKASYIIDLAKKINTKEVDLSKVQSVSDEEVIRMLTQVKGIGQWTAEMFLMFSLNRPDIFSYGDLGLKNAIKKLYKLSQHPTKEEAIILSERWKPYRTLACRILWRYNSM